MINYLLFAALLSTYSKATNVEAQNICQIYYNKALLQEFSGVTKGSIVHLKAGLIKDTDSLSIKYVTKNVCNNCLYELRIPTPSAIHFFEVSKSLKTISLSLKKLLTLQADNNMLPLPISFIENKGLNPSQEVLQFSIKIE